MLRLGGRLQNLSVIDIFQPQPIVLPAKNARTYLIHAGQQSILSSLQLKYWPINGRNIARDVIHCCVQCFKYHPVVTQPIMGDLPKSESRCRFCSAFYIKGSLRSKDPVKKAYAFVWVCFATKAVHIELLNDLTTQAFLTLCNVTLF